MHRTLRLPNAVSPKVFSPPSPLSGRLVPRCPLPSITLTLPSRPLSEAPDGKANCPLLDALNSTHPETLTPLPSPQPACWTAPNST